MGSIVVYGAAATGALGGLLYATVAGVNGWSEIVVLAGIVLATVGVLIAVDPLRVR